MLVVRQLRDGPISFSKSVILVVAITLVACTPSPPADVGCDIASHTENDSVGQHITVKGTANGMKPEWSMYSYARARIPGEPWWRSDRKATTAGDNWSIDVVIGNEQTSPGTEFEVAIAVASEVPNEPMVDELPDTVVLCDTVTLRRE